MSNTVTQKPKDILEDRSWLGGFLVASRITAAGIGARLAQSRKEKGITQGELAEILGVSQPMVSDYGRGELRLHGELIIEIAKVLKVTADELLGIKTESQKSNAIKNRRLSRRLTAVDQLPKRDQEALLRTIDAFISKT